MPTKKIIPKEYGAHSISLGQSAVNSIVFFWLQRKESMETRLITDTKARIAINGAAYTPAPVAETWGAAIPEASVHACNVQTGIT